MERDEKKLLKSALILSIISMIVLFFSFIKESLFAYYYGASSFTDAFNIAIQIPVVIFSLISTSISNIVLPVYSKELYTKGHKFAEEYICNLTTIISIITIIIIIFCEIFSKKIVFLFAPGLDIETRNIAILLFRLIVPTVLITEIININIAVLNVHKNFILPSLMSILLSVSFICCIVFFNSYNIYAALLGIIIGTFLEGIFSIFLRKKYIKYTIKLNLKDENIKLSLKNAIPIFIGIGVDEVNKLVDSAISSFLREGSITLLNYSLKLTSAISMLLIKGISTAIYPEFAEHISNKNEKNLSKSLIFSIKILIIILLPVVSGGIILSKEIIVIIFFRGAFTIKEVYKTAPLFSCYLFCLVFTSIRQVVSKVFYSYGDTKTPMKNSVIGVFINIILNLLFVKFFDAFGLALATTISSLLISILLLKKIKRKNMYIEYTKVISTLLKVIISCLTMSFIINLLINYFKKIGLYNLNSLYNTAFIIFICVVVGILTYIIICNLLKIKEVEELLKNLKKSCVTKLKK